MSKELNAQELINAFLAAIRLKRQEQCQAILESLEALSGQNPTLQAWCTYFKGYQVFEFQRDWAKAERIFTKLLQTEPEPTLHGPVLYTLGRSLDAQGRWEEAIAAFEQSLLTSTQLGQITEQARAWKHMAISLHKGFTQGDFDSSALQQAIAYCRLALDVLEPIIDPPQDIVWLKGTIWNTLGVICMNLGQWDEAIACYQQDLAICHALDDRFGLGLTYGNLGEVYQKHGNWPESLKAYQQALNLIREFNDRYEEIEALANIAYLYQEMAEYEPALDYYSQAIQLIEDMRVGISSEDAQAGFFATVVDTYANMALLCLTANRPEQAFNIVEQARSRTFLDSLAVRSPKLAEQMQQKEAAIMTLAEVQTALPADTLLLEYFTTGLVEAKEGRTAAQSAQRHRFPPAQTLLFVITRDGFQVFDTGLSPNDLRPQQLNSVVERHFLSPQIRRTLYDRLIAPVETLLQGKRRLYILPHGPLHYIPFQALLAPDGETLLCEDGPQLIYAPSATLLFRHRRAEADPAASPCLALGYNGEGDQRLRFAEEEARSIAHLTGGQALVEPRSPKKAELYRQAARYRFLHFSCHGEFDPDTPLASALHLGPEEALTALDVLDHLHLRCDLVTLSACESGLSRVRRGDELIGLTRAFMYAGASALVSTLWRVDERSTRILMEKFYQEIQIGLDFAEALKQAQLYLKRLTHREALNILTHSLAPADEGPTPVIPPDESPGDLPGVGAAWQQARAYLKGLAGEGEQDDIEILPDVVDEDQIFAAPFYWAPFILIS
jgi:CHAT domain-containing protein